MLFTLNSYYSQWEHYVCAWPTFVCMYYMQNTSLPKLYARVRLFSSHSSSSVCLHVLNNREKHRLPLSHRCSYTYDILLLFFFVSFCVVVLFRGKWMFYPRCLCAVDKQFMRKFLQNFVNRT